MRSIRVPLELTVRLVRVVEGVENTNACVSLLMLGRCIAMLPLTERIAAFCTHCIGASAARPAEGQGANKPCLYHLGHCVNDARA
jgi:hypothetical protein